MSYFRSAIAYGFRQLISRRIYLTMMIVVPLAVAFYFVDLMDEGLPLKVPSGVVDLDHSSLSREVTRNLGASELVSVSATPESYAEAIDMVKSGKIFGFFLIPDNFEHDALSGRKATLSYYSNMTYFVPGSLVFKGFTTQAVTTVGGLAVATLTSIGASEDMASGLISPVNFQLNMPGNPWMNYNIYLSNSFIPGVIALLVALITVFTILIEIKDNTSRRWLELSGGSTIVAVAGKLIPQWLIFTIVGFACQAYLYGFNHFPMNCPLWHMLLAMALLVAASQGFAMIVICLIPNLRMALSVCALSGILAFSIAAFSYPVDQMYGAIGIFSYILPVRYYFLIYVDQALNGIPLYYSRIYYAALLLFPLLGLLGVKRLQKRLLNPVYVP